MEDPIKKKIQELCPDVMELKFGCEVADVHDRKRMILKFIPKHPEKYDAFVTLADQREWEPDSFLLEGFNNNFEILGSPITLAVVLRAIEKAWTDEDYVCSSRGYFGHIDSVDHNKRNTVRWDLTNDSYDAQTKETQLFIGSLLGCL